MGPPPSAAPPDDPRAKQAGPVRRRPMDMEDAPLSLTSRLQGRFGIGPRRAEALAKLGIHTVGDLVEHLPFRHERHTRTTIDSIPCGETATIIGRIIAFRARRGPRGPAARAAIVDNTGRCSATWFNARDPIFDQLATGVTVELTGKVREFGGLPQFVNPAFRVVPSYAAPIRRGESATLDAIYPATAGMKSAALRRLIQTVLPAALPLIEEFLPQAFRAARDLPPRRVAIERMHRPTSPQDVEVARRRLAFEELLLMQLAVQMARRRRREQFPTRPIPCTPELDARIRQRLPYSLTPAQNRAVAEIVSDLARRVPMNRLLQGDVGCGKTAVAVYAALLAVANRRQVAVLAPTELLARQHDATIRRMLEGSRVRQALWVGGGSKRERTALRDGAAAGDVDLVVGTQALLEADVVFKDLGLVIVDEQHRFGVRQRAVMAGKGPSPHYLIMTATPIPRTLAMTVFGDLDVSTIDELPPGRAGIQTRIVGPGELPHVWRFIASRLSKGEQAYIVYPLVNDADGLPLKSAVAEARRVAALLPQGQVGLLHGQLTDAEKDAVMRDFAAGTTQVLVATTVVEVGIDVPSATVMVVQHAERYGLAQLHQLRGRVGRGGKAGYCYLVVEDAPSTSQRTADGPAAGPAGPRFPLRPGATAGGPPAGRPTGSAAAPAAAPVGAADSRSVESAASRLSILTQTTDGFLIAEEDLRQRGPGELLGIRQHGLPALRAADLTRDVELLSAARRDAAELLKGDPDLAHPEWAAVRRIIMDRFAGGMRFLAGA